MKKRSIVWLLLFLLLFGGLKGQAQAALPKAFCLLQRYKTERLSDGIYEIRSALAGRFVLDIKNSGQAGGDTKLLQLYKKGVEVNQQKFYLERFSENQFRLFALHSWEALTAPENPENSMQAFTAAAEGGNGPGRSWKILDSGDGRTCYIRSMTGKFLTCDTPFPYNGAKVVLTDYTGDRSQKWILRKTFHSMENTLETDVPNPYGADGRRRNQKIVFRFGSKTEVLTAATLKNWMVQTEDRRVVPDSGKISGYLEELAKRYDTYGKPRNFTTSYGSEITLYYGNFGWKLDQDGMAALLSELIQSGRSKTMKPVFSGKGAVWDGKNDIGDSYVEVDLVGQRVWLYKDGELIASSDCVSGTRGTDRETPGGVYSIYGKQSPTVLVGEDYQTPVDFWMPFNGGIGLHDATWRWSFGGDIYTYDGSHGCINLPYDTAETIYRTVYVGYPVVCYH
ncbi:MAG: L,D-transpeptidase family protein [Eubacteriales bacterium]|nr:L,D-transpeptidase family protein [Eubacteriales bacterium]